MRSALRAGMVALALVMATTAACRAADAGKAANGNAAAHLLLDVTVTGEHGNPVMGLSPFAFHVADDGVAQRVLAIQDGGLMLPGSKTPAEMVIVLDGVNCEWKKMQLARQDVAEFLRRRGGKLPVPTRIVVLSDTWMKISPHATEDGNALAKYIEQTPNPVHSLRFQAGYYGELDRAMWTMDQMYKLAHLEAPEPGRKLVVWISHGWHPLARDYLAMDEADLKRDFSLDVGLTNALLQARITLTSIDPILALPGENLDYYQAFLKPVEKWEQVDTPNLLLQVLASHTGGMVLNQSTDIQGEIEQAMRTLNGWYTLVYSPKTPDDGKPFHPILVTLAPDAAAKPGRIQVRGPQGYYVSTP